MHRVILRISQSLLFGLLFLHLCYPQQESIKINDYPALINELQEKDSLSEWAYLCLDFGVAIPGESSRILQKYTSEVWRKPNDTLEAQALLYLYINTGYYTRVDGDILRSARAYQAASDLYDNYPITTFDAGELIWKPLGNHYTRLGEYEKAEVIHQKNIDWGIKKGNANFTASSFSNLGIVYQSLGKPGESVKSYQEGLQIKGLDRRREGLLLSNLAKALLANGKNDAALEKAYEAIAILSTLSDDDMQSKQWLAGTYFAVGQIWEEKSDYYLAKQHYLVALKLAEAVYPSGKNREIAKNYIALGYLSFRQNNLKEAAGYFNRSLSRLIHSFEADSVASLPRVEDLYEENTIFEALSGKAAVFQRMYDRDSSTQWLQLALDAHDLSHRTELSLRQTYISQTSKLTLQRSARERSDSQLEVVDKLYAHTQDQELVKKALAVSEENKSRLLRDHVRDNLDRVKLDRDLPILERERTLLRYLSYLERSLSTLAFQENPDEALLQTFKTDRIQTLDAIKKIRDSLTLKYPGFGKMDRMDVSYESYNLLAASDSTCIIEYYLSDTHLYTIALIGGKDPVFRSVRLTDEFKEMLDDFPTWFSSRNAISTNPGEYNIQAHALYELLIKPVLNTFDRSSYLSLTIVPDGILAFIPFESLVTTQDSAASPIFLVEQAQISYAYSLSVLALQQEMETTNTEWLAVVPMFSNNERNLPELTYSDKETGGFKRNKSDILKADDATLKRFLELAPSSALIHLSTHAQLDAKGMAMIEFIDSSLFLPEIYSSRLNPELTLLSSCETGIGLEEKGEGLMSLARAFAFAGSRSLIASLWKLNDASTANIIADFYRQLKKGKSKSEALRTAKLNHLNNPKVSAAERTPYYWAGLVFIGADGPLLPPGGGIPYFLFVVMGLLILVGFIAIIRNKRK